MVRFKHKRKGSLLVGTIIVVSVSSVIAGSIFLGSKNIVKLSNYQKENLYVNNILLSEIEVYKAKELSKIEDTNYVLTIDNVNYNVSINVKKEDTTFKELEITVSNDTNILSRSQIMKRHL